MTPHILTRSLDRAAIAFVLIVAAVVYLGGLAVLYVKQREMLFPIPPVGRTAPAAAGLPEAEEHVQIGRASCRERV